MISVPDPLLIVHFPDSRLRRHAEDVTSDEFGPPLHDLVAKMFELMRRDKGVGLAAPQVGIPKRLFVMNQTGKPEDDRVYVNPVLTDPDGLEKGEEGCLSLPGIRADILRDLSITIAAQDLDGQHFTQTAEGYMARVWQHEFDHLNGVLILDRMGPVAQMQCRKKVKELEAKFAKALGLKKK